VKFWGKRACFGTPQFVELMVLCVVVQAFGWFALGAYIVDLVFAVIEFRKSRVSRSEATMRQETTTTTSARY